MTRFRLPYLGLKYYWRSHLATVLGAAAASAALVGALIVGDSIRSSLRLMALNRLGRMDHVMASPGFFRDALAEDIKTDEAFAGRFESAGAAVLLPGSAEHADTSAFARGVQVLGVDENFWKFDSTSNPDSHSMGEREAAVNSTLARAIGLEVGHEILVRFDRPDAIPAEAVAGRKTERIETLRLTVARIVPDSGLAKFSLFAGQQISPNIFIPLTSLQKAIQREGMANLLFVSSRSEVLPPEPGPFGITSKLEIEKSASRSEEESKELDRILRDSVKIEDLGLVARVNAAPSYVSIESARMVLKENEIAAATDAATTLGLAAAPTLTYLANTIRLGEKEIPYSTVTALDPTATAPLGPLRLVDEYAANPLKENEILLNEWAAAELGAKPGDRVALTYYMDGERGELTTAMRDDLIVTGTVVMKGPAGDPGLTPEFPGIADAKTMRDWDPPFPVDLSRIRDADEKYWDEHRATPKAFIALETGLKMWSSQHGSLTSVRIAPPTGEPASYTAHRLSREIVRRIPPESAGLVFQPIKYRSVMAGAGSSDFAGLFIGFSFFIIISAVLLTRLFFALGVQRRSREIGLLLAVGFNPAQARRLFLIEGTLLTLVGTAMGIGLGTEYARLMIYGLTTWWVDAVGTTELAPRVLPATLGIGAGIGIVVAWFSVFWAARIISRSDPARLLAGGVAGAGETISIHAARRKRIIASLLGFLFLAGAVGSVIASKSASAQLQAMLFYAGGTCALVGSLYVISAALRGGFGGVTPGGIMRMFNLGVGNASRNHARTILTVALTACASFVIVAVGANRHHGHAPPIAKDSGNGGFALMAQSDAPIFLDLNSEKGRGDLGLQPETSAALAESHVYAMKFEPGENAGCLNLYRPTQPQILGASKEFISRGGFAFASSLAQDENEKINPWLLLGREQTDNSIPAIADLNTVMWILHSGLGKTMEIEDAQGKSVTLKFVALLKGSPLQGELIVSESNFERLFPGRAGNQFFFIESPDQSASATQLALETDLRDYGFDAFPVQERIDAYRAIESTYLSTFQMLGGLGFLLGTFGLGAVMLRNILERRSELALLRAFGYRPSAIARMVMAESAFLLWMGLLAGTASALLAVSPRWIEDPTGFPWASLGLTLAAVAATGMLAGLISVFVAIRSPILTALRSP